MSEWEQRLLAVVLLVCVFNLKNWRGLALVGLMVADYIATTAWYEYNLPSHEIATAAIDSLFVVGYVIAFARYKWELAVGGIFIVSAMSSIFKVLGFYNSQELYALALELCNWAALLVIGSVGIVRWIPDGAFSWLDQKHSARRLGSLARVAVWAEAKQHVQRRQK